MTAVMLHLVASIDSEGSVNTFQAIVAQRCKITMKELREAIDQLSSSGLITSVQLSPESRGSLSCVINPIDVRRKRAKKCA